MKTLVAGLLALTLAVFLALEVRNDNGYVLLGYGEWTVEGSLAFFLFANLLLFLLLYLALRLLARVWSVPRQVHGWQDRRAQRRARKELTQGLLELSEGDWKGAEKKTGSPCGSVRGASAQLSGCSALGAAAGGG